MKHEEGLIPSDLVVAFGGALMIVAILMAGLMMVSGCNSPGDTGTATVGPAVAKTSVPECDPVGQTTAVLGIRVNGTEANPTYGNLQPTGDTICCWRSPQDAYAAGLEGAIRGPVDRHGNPWDD